MLLEFPVHAVKVLSHALKMLVVLLEFPRNAEKMLVMLLEFPVHAVKVLSHTLKMLVVLLELRVDAAKAPVDAVELAAIVLRDAYEMLKLIFGHVRRPFLPFPRPRGPALRDADI